MAVVVVSVEDPSTPDVAALLARHLAFAREVTPEDGVFAFDPSALRRAEVTLFGARAAGLLLGVAAILELDAGHGELKSMHVAPEARGQGVGRALVAHVLDTARGRGYRRVSLETGSFAAFAPARELYAACGFTPCAPYGDYVGSATSACMTIGLDPTLT